MLKKIIKWLSKYISDNGFKDAPIEKPSVEDAPSKDDVAEIVPTQVDFSKYRVVKRTYGDGMVKYCVEHYGQCCPSIGWEYYYGFSTKKEAIKHMYSLIEAEADIGYKIIKKEVVS